MKDRQQLLFNKNKENEQNDVRCSFITDYKLQSKKLETTIKKHWSNMLRDETLRKIKKRHPKFIYRKNKSLWNKIVKKILDPQNK